MILFAVLNSCHIFAADFQTGNQQPINYHPKNNTNMDTRIQAQTNNQPTEELWMASIYRSATMPNGTKVQECMTRWISISWQG